MASKAELIDQLEDRDAEIARLTQAIDTYKEKELERDKVIEEMVKKEYPPRGADLRKVVTLQTKEDMRETIEFLDRFEHHMPLGLYRIYLGAMAHYEEFDKTT